MFVHGGVRGADGRTVWPTLEAIADRVGVTKAAVCQRAKRYGWHDKRAAIEAGNTSEAVRKALTAGKRPTLKPGALLDVYLALFEEQVLAGNVRFDSFPDFERAVKLKASLDAAERENTERAGVLTLDQLRARHRAHATAEGGLTDEASGVLAHGTGEVGGEQTEAEARAQTPTSEPEADAVRVALTVAATVGKRQSKATAPPKARGKSAA